MKIFISKLPTLQIKIMARIKKIVNYHIIRGNQLETNSIIVSTVRTCSNTVYFFPFDCKLK